MSIIYIHGVSVRDPAHGVELGKSFRKWLGAKIVVGPDGVDYLPVFWGDIAAKFRWDLACRPRTKLLKQGGADTAAFQHLGALRDAGADLPLARPGSPGPVADGPTSLKDPVASAPQAPPARPLSDVPREKRPDFLADLYLAARFPPPRPGAAEEADPMTDDASVASLAAASAVVAARWDEIVAAHATEDERAARLMQAVDAALSDDGLKAMGGLSDWMSRAGAVVRRAGAWPGDAVSTVFAELRPKLTNFAAHFLGDVLAYLNTREVDGKPGPIPGRVLDALEKAHARKNATGERIVVVTHSMGGQLFYDFVVAFAATRPALADLEVDHWFSCGSQVSFFAELGVFKGQPDVRHPAKLSRPQNVAAWTNFFDGNDIVGFIMAPVFDGVDDLEYDTGYGLASAHTGFLARPGFFEAMAKRL